jgi:hypothetical protein
MQERILVTTHPCRCITAITIAAVMACSSWANAADISIANNDRVGRPETEAPIRWLDTTRCVAHPTFVTVFPGQSLQAAVDRARPGTVISVTPGRYKGCLDLGGTHGTNANPILLISEAPGAAELAGEPTCAVISAGISRGGVSNVGIYGFTIVANMTCSRNFGPSES